MQNTPYFSTMARYNHWMNQKLYAVCAAMPDETRKKISGTPFQSMHGVLNHLLLTDRVWLGRFQNRPFAARSLDQELFADFEELKTEREKTDAEISQWVSSLTEVSLASPFTFTPMSNPVEQTLPLWMAALHLFNHQTHHRGQLTALIDQASFDCGVTDLPRMPLLEE